MWALGPGAPGCELGPEAQVPEPDTSDGPDSGAGTETRGAQSAGSTPAPAKPVAPAPAKPKPQVAANGAAPAAGQPAAPAPAEAPAEANPQAADGLLVNGSQVNGGASPFALNPAFGNNRRGPRSLYTYMIGFNLNSSALDARPFSQTGQLQPKAQYNNYAINGLIGGPLRIRHIVRNGPNFTVQYQLSRNRNAGTAYALVPTQAQRNGDLSNVTTPIIDPTTGLQFPGNIIPADRLTTPQAKAAQALLAYFPLPNFSSSQYNYQIPTLGSSHGDFVNIRMNKQIGRKNSILGTFAFQSTRASTPNNFGFPFLDTSSGLGMNINPQWRRQFTPRFSTTLQYQFSRNANHNYSFFENRSNVSGLAGITGNNQNPTYWGPPNLNFGSSAVSPMNDGVPAFIRPETNMIRDDNTWNHGRHEISFWADYMRQEFNYLNQANPRGGFSFTGAATALTPGGGSDLADFLLGIPDSATLAFGNADKYLRGTNYDASFQDNWRVNSALTVVAGVQWGYQAPVTEKYGRLVNLDVAPGFTAAQPVCSQAQPTSVPPCSGPVGPQTGASYPNALLHPDKHAFQPLLSLAWRPISGSSLVVRAAYQIRYTTSVYQAIATQMFQQAPLSTSLQVANTAANPLTLTNGFLGSPATEATTFAVDPNFKIGYAQNWTVTIQKDLPWGMQMQANYTGIKGTRMPQTYYPNSWAPGGTDPCPSCPVGFAYEASNGNLTREAGSFQLRRRLHNGFTAQVQYTYAKSIDDLPSGQAQNWLDLSAERGLSSTDQRHLVVAQLQYTSGMGIGGGTFLTGWKAAALKEWTFVFPITWGTGLPENPNYSSAVLGGTAFNGPLRPEFTGQPLYAAPQGLGLNPAAFAAPPPGMFGNMGKDSITAPDQFSFERFPAAHLPGKRPGNLEFAGGFHQHPQPRGLYQLYVATFGSPQLGLATGANGMRTMSTTAQFRF